MDIQTAAIEIRRIQKFFMALQHIDEILEAANNARNTLDHLDKIKKDIVLAGTELASIKDTRDKALMEADTYIEGQEKRQKEAMAKANSVIEEINKRVHEAHSAHDASVKGMQVAHEEERMRLAGEKKALAEQIENIMQQKRDLEGALAALRKRVGVLTE
jgi:hypothetical protein